MARRSKNGQTESTIFSKLTSEEENCLKVLLEHKHIYDLYEKTGELVNFHAHIQNEILDAYQGIEPHYSYNRGCPVCVAEFMDKVYKWYKSKL